MSKEKRPISANKLVDIWARKVKERDEWTCQLCDGTDGQMHAHHVLGRSTNRLKFDLLNGVCLCADHHKWHGVHSQDSDIARDAIDRLYKKLGDERMAYLRDLKLDKRKLTLAEARERLEAP